MNPEPAAARPTFWRQLIDMIVEYRMHLFVSGAATAITNTMHWFWNQANASATDAYWHAYARGAAAAIHHCLTGN